MRKLLICTLSLTTLVVVQAQAAGGSFQTLYSFKNGVDGASPIGGVIVGPDAVIYGETSYGGAVPCTTKAGRPSKGCGTVYSLDRNGSLKVLVSFTGPNGAYGQNTLAMVGSTLYGTAQNGGAFDLGIVFSVKTDGTDFKIIHSFNGFDGQAPADALRIGRNGTIYGITQFGGAMNYGVLYAITPTGTYSILHTFTGSTTDGRTPETLLMSPTGILVGGTVSGGIEAPQACSYGCGTVFEYVLASGRYSVPYFFTGSSGFGGFLGSFGPNSTLNGNDGLAPYTLSLDTGLMNVGSFSVVETGGVSSGPIRSSDGSLIGVNGVGALSGGLLYSASNGVITELANPSGPTAQPALLPSGSIVGNASRGGLCTSCGSIYSYTP